MMKRYIFSMVLIAGTALASPAGAQTAPYSGPSYYWVEDAVENMAARGMSKHQIRQDFGKYGVNMTIGTIDAVMRGSLGTNAAVANQVTYALKTGDTSGLQQHLMRNGLIEAAELTDQYMPGLADLVKGGACSSVAMDAAGAVASGIAGVFTGGRATVVAQLAQQVQLIWANKCNAQMNDSLASLQDYEQKNISHGAVNGIPGINGMINRTMPGLGNGGFLSAENAIRDQYGEVYPDMFPPMTGPELVEINKAMEQHEREANLNTAAIQNRAVQEQTASLTRARDYAALGRSGPGIRAELQAGNAIQGEQIAALNSLTAATVGSQRAEAEARMREEAKKKAANATTDEFMSNMTACANCNISRPFLGN